ncbi:sensor histidine kinase [Bremerella cremea]|uniref:histidine kinase n=1 Tax=Bremerella cremea TaxID=1031537 RepID=A0A368KSP8_9BACT|nr:HAMP domain-containing sensor histidine kinase [Bremerella cremea]RCS51913.1 sensor histidine kinase [Bremerella cremea]
MRWPLIYQVTLPLALWTLLTVFALSMFNLWYAQVETGEEVQDRLTAITKQVAEVRFPLSLPVLQQIQALTGTELALTDGEGKLLRGTTTILPEELTHLLEETGSADVDLSHIVQLSGESFFHSTTPAPFSGTDRLTVHLLYPKANYDRRVTQSFWPLMLLGLLAVGPMLLVASVLAARITRPIARLQKQVGRIAEGDFVELPPGKTNDELNDLAQAINGMSHQLESYEAKVRTMERAQVLGQIGAGFSHQIRNAMTGGQMAIGLHRLDCNIPDCESLQVAERQMKMVEHMVQSMLRLGRKQEISQQEINVKQLIESTVAMIGPQASHHSLPIHEKITLPPEAKLSGDFVLLQTCLMNLLLNGIEATLAAQAMRPGEKESGTEGGKLQIDAAPHIDGKSITIRICDEGMGPSAAIAEQLFEPLVTTKKEGTGLGLPVVREIVELHGGTIEWYRVDEKTCFQITLPRVATE